MCRYYLTYNIGQVYSEGMETSNSMFNVKAEVERLRNDPDHLRRKAAWIREQAKRGGPRTQQRLDRAAELEQTADRLDTATEGHT